MYHELSHFPVEGENFDFISCVTVWLKCSSEINTSICDRIHLSEPDYQAKSQTVSILHSIPLTPSSDLRLLHYIALVPKGKQTSQKKE